MVDLVEKIADELKLAKTNVEGALALLRDEATVPFIARYRKDKTSGLDEVALFAIRDRLKYLTELEDRRAFIIKNISDAGKMTPNLQERIEKAPTKAELEDLYIPFRSRRRTRSTAAKQKGLDGLAELIWKQETTTGRVDEHVQPFINEAKGVKDMAEALSGARDIVAERIAEDAACRKIVRDLLLAQGKVTAKAREGVALAKGKFAAYAQFSESLSKIPSHRLLAVMRGASEKQLAVAIEAPRDKILEELKNKVVGASQSIFKPEIILAVEESYDRLLAPSMDNETRQELKHRADLEAIDVFARNLRALLLQAPLGGKRVLAIDPGLRTGCKAAVLGETGKLLAHTVLFTEKSPEEQKAAADKLAALIKENQVAAIAVGNGTGGREAGVFVRDVLKTHEIKDVILAVVNESGASVYSASPLARDEFPDLDLTVRGTVSIGRRLQDPLAELVKLEPNSIGVGQYQHDVDQILLRLKLEEVVESCVNNVGVDVNTASSELLRYVAGIGPKLSKSLVEARNTKGGFKSREDLREVSGLGPKAFEQCAGFLRIRDGASPLDNSAVHPEAYSVVEAMAASLNCSVKELIGNGELVQKLDLNKFKSEQFGDYTLKDIVEELNKPGRDPRATFINPEFNESVRELKDVQIGAILNGVVTNLTAFGAFVDIGVHQDGLVHISAITSKFIRDPSEVLSIGQQVKVKVIGVDQERKRISLSIKATQERPPRKPGSQPRRPRSVPASPETQAAVAGAVPAGTPATAEAAAQASASAAAPGASSRPRFPRPPRRPYQPRGAGASPAGKPVQGSAGGSKSEIQTPGSPSPAQVVATKTAGQSAKGPAENARRAGPPRGPRCGDDRGRRPGQSAPPAAPGKPDFSKFFVKSKRKEKERVARREEGASREEVREVLRKQESGGTTLGDLLKKAGVPTEDK
jgi:uncharacterized protein